MGTSGVISTANFIANRSESVTSPLEDYRLIELTRGQFAKVDAEDYLRVSAFKWCALLDTTTGNFYARRQIKIMHRKYAAMLMHREILGLSYGDPRKGDHINRLLTLDNRRSNLRIVTAQESVCNRGLFKVNKSGFRGVSWSLSQNCWVSQIMYMRKSYCLGFFTEQRKEDAARAYDEAALRFHGQFAQLNFPLEKQVQ